MLKESGGYTTAAVSTAGNSPEWQAANDLAVDQFFSMPAELSDVDPAWSTCTPVYRGAWDPPRVLIPVANLGPTTTSAPTSTLLTSPATSVSSSLPKATTSPESSPDGDPMPLFGELLHSSNSKANLPSPTDRKADSSTAQSTLPTSRQPKKGSLSVVHTTTKASHSTASLSAADRTTSILLNSETKSSGTHVQADTVGIETASSQTITQEYDPVALSRMVAAMAQAAEKATTSARTAYSLYTTATTGQVTGAPIIAEERYTKFQVVEQSGESTTMAIEMTITSTASQNLQLGSSVAPTDDEQSAKPTARETADSEMPLVASSHGNTAQAQETANVSGEQVDPATPVIIAASSKINSEVETSRAVANPISDTESVALSTVVVSPVPVSSPVDSNQFNKPSIPNPEITALSVVTLSPIPASATSAIAQEGAHPTSDSANTRNSVVTLYPFPTSSSVSSHLGGSLPPTTRKSVSGFVHSMSGYKLSDAATSLIYDTASEPQATSESTMDAKIGPLASLMISVMDHTQPSTSRQSSQLLPDIVFNTSMDSVLLSIPTTPTGSARNAIDTPIVTGTQSQELAPTAGTEASADSSVTGTTGTSSEPSESAFLFSGEGVQTRRNLSKLGLVLWVGMAVMIIAA